MTTPSYMLHNDVHHLWGDGRLKFLLLDVASTEPPARAGRLIAESLVDMGIVAFAIYDVLGKTDLVVRCWVPSALRSRVVRHTLLNLSEPDVSMCRIIPVEKILLHWPWGSVEAAEERGREYEHVDTNALEMEFPVATRDANFIRQLNALLSDSPAELLDEPIVDRLSELNAIRYVGPGTMPVEARGTQIAQIKTITLLSALEPEMQQFVAEGLKKALVGLGKVSGNVSGISLYHTQGSQFASFVVIASLRAEGFHTGIKELLSTLSVTGYRKYMQLTPSTFVVASPSFLQWQDLLPNPEDDDATHALEVGAYARPVVDIEALLAQEESATLEFKSTFYADLRRWLLDDELVALEQLFLKGIIREVVAFLNSREGGTLLVGVCESNRQLENLDPARRQRAVGQLSTHPSRGAKVLVGTELDRQLPKRGRIFRDTDSIELHVMERLRTAISMTTSIVSRVDVSTHMVDDRVVTRIDVRSLRGRNWAYSNDEPGPLLVKHGSSTLSLLGAEADNYRTGALEWDASTGPT